MLNRRKVDLMIYDLEDVVLGRMRTAITEAADQGIRCAIVIRQKEQAELTSLLKNLGARIYLTLIFLPAIIGRRRIIDIVLTELHITPKRACYVSDSEDGVRIAEEIGLVVVSSHKPPEESQTPAESLDPAPQAIATD